MTPFELLTYAAASWYVAYVITSSDGPMGIFIRLREWRGGRWHGRRYKWTTLEISGSPENPKVTKSGEVKAVDGLLDCIICLTPWVAAALYLLHIDTLTNVLAIAGAALWAHSYTNWRMKL